MNDSLKECVKASLLGSLDGIKKSKWGIDRMGSYNVKVWGEKWTVKI